MQWVREEVICNSEKWNCKSVNFGAGSIYQLKSRVVERKTKLVRAFALPCAAARRHHRMASALSYATPFPFSNMQPNQD